MKSLSHSNLIHLFVKYEIPNIDEEKILYLEFRDRRDPTFYLFKFQGIFTKTEDEIFNLFKTINLDSELKFVDKNILPSQPKKIMNKYIDFEIIKNQYYQDNSILEKYSVSPNSSKKSLTN